MMEDSNWKLVDERGGERGIYAPNPRWIVKIDNQCVNGVKHWSINVYFEKDREKEDRETILEKRGTIVEDINTRSEAIELMKSWISNDPVIID